MPDTVWNGTTPTVTQSDRGLASLAVRVAGTGGGGDQFKQMPISQIADFLAISSYPTPTTLTPTDFALGSASGVTVAVPYQTIAELMVSIIAGNPTLIAQLANLILTGRVPFALPDEASGGTLPTPGSGLPYLSAGAVKIA